MSQCGIIDFMQFVSIHFIIFLIFAILGYYCCNAKYRYLFLLLCNFLFYFSWIREIIDFVPLVAVILITWLSALVLEKKKNKFFLVFSIVFSFSFLVFYKYTNFCIDNINGIGRLISADINVTRKTIIAPIGISFFSFQAVGYLIDVYRGKVETEKNLLRYATYVSFFPTITSGPIERSNTLLKKINESVKLSFQNIQKGTILFVYGAFVKLVIASRLSIIADQVFNDYCAYGGAILVWGAVAYSLQIYCDFSSYSYMASGIAKCLGIDVIENFKAPYFSQTMQEFWRRWHVSLSTWFRDYVYISLGGNRCSKTRKNINLLITFLVSGLWHNANWTFIVWGGLHGIYQIIGNSTQTVRMKIANRLNLKRDCFSARFFRTLFVFLCTAVAWIFFRADTLIDALRYLSIIISEHKIWQLVDGTLFSLGVSNFEMDILYVSLLVMCVVDFKKYKTDKNIDVLIINQNILFRWLSVSLLIMMTLVLGMYGSEFNAQDFIYFNF